MADATTDYRNLLPDQLRNYVGCFVELTLCEVGKLRGWIYTIDPVSHAIVLAKASEEGAAASKSIVIIMAKAVKQFRIVETTRGQPDWLDDFASKRKHGYTGEELEKRKTSVIEWLRKNRVPIVDNSEIEQENIKVIDGLVYIEPPYDGESCQGTNEIVLERIRKLVNSMPRL